MRLSEAQIDVLLRGIVKSRVRERDNMSYVETWDIRAMMNRVFGFCGWSLISTSPTTLVFERERTVGKDKKPGFTVAYKAELELIIHTPEGDAHYAGTAIGEATMPDYKLGDAHDMAAKSAESGALKRAATNLGDQFGLSLYRGGLDPVVRRIVGYTPGQQPPIIDTDDHGPVLQPVPAAEPSDGEAQEPSVTAEQALPAQVAAAQPTDAGVGDQGPPPESPAPTSLDGDAALKRRMEAVETEMKGFNNRQKVAVNAVTKGMFIKAYTCPVDDEELAKVLDVIGKIASGELP
jgi:hypothetical protein